MSNECAASCALDQARCSRLKLVDRLRPRIPEALEAIIAFMLDSMPDPLRDAQLTLGWRDVVNACLECGLLAIEQGEEWSGPVPPIVVVQERRAVSSDIDLSMSVARYTAIYRLAWDYVLQELDNGDIPHEDKTKTLREASTATVSLLTQLIAAVTEVHVGELKLGLRSSAQNDARLARKILAGERVNEGTIDYDFAIEHVGIIAWGKDAAKALACVADRLGYRRWIVSNDDGMVWAWLGSGRCCVVDDIEKVLADDAFAGVFVAIGESASKLVGFRETHGLAQGAYFVAQLSQHRITRYADVAREARALQDPLHAKWLMRTYIAPVVEHRDGMMLVKALEKFYEAARNVDKAAKLLNRDRHTVNRWLDKIGEVIGRELRTCHAEMEVALRLAQLHGNPTESTQLSLRS